MTLSPSFAGVKKGSPGKKEYKLYAPRDAKLSVTPQTGGALTHITTLDIAGKQGVWSQVTEVEPVWIDHAYDLLIIVGGEGAYTGAAAKAFAIAKAKNTLKAKAKKATLTAKAKTLAKKDVTVKRTKAISVSKAKGTVTYKLAGASKKAKVSLDAKGNITLAKGLAKGTHTVKVKVKAAGTANYKARTITVALKFKVS